MPWGILCRLRLKYSQCNFICLLYEYIVSWHIYFYTDCINDYTYWEFMTTCNMSKMIWVINFRSITLEAVVGGSVLPHKL